MAERRNTVQQNIVYRTLCDMHNHPTAEMVFKQIRGEHPSIGRATVFRILGRMAEDGRILRVPNDSGADSFDHNTEEHCHVRCIKCGKVDDVNMKKKPNPEADIEAASGYQISGYYLVFSGICQKCDVNIGNVTILT